MTRRRRAAILCPIVLALSLLSGCASLTKLTEVGRPPDMSPIEDPTRAPNYHPLTMPMPATSIAAPEANTLWRSGSRAFFKDQRAAQVGDILTVLVNVADTAVLDNNTTAGRNANESMGVPNFFGFEQQLPKILWKATNPAQLVTTNSANNNTGKAQLQRDETVTLRLAAVVTQVLPNGNLVIAAKQEVRVNSELRELQVTGVIRPQDIASDNTIQHDRMAEARISYGGRGTLTDVQTPRWGQQVLDAILPF